jgi:uncharacterized coiled-coil protein SlyX
MKNYRLFFALLLCLLGANCNPSAKTKQAIKELEEQVASQESDIRTLTDEITRVTPKPGSLDPESARQLQEKYKALNEKVSKLAQMESDYGRLTRDNASLRKQLATAVKSAGTAGVLDQDGKILKKTANSIIIIEGDQNSGTGFALAVDGKKYVYTAAHVLSGNNKLTIRSSSGTVFTKFGTLEAAEGADLVRMQILDEVSDSLVLYGTGDGSTDGMEVAVLGKDSGTAALIKGRVSATNGDVLEMDALVTQNTGGAAVVDMNTGKVVGLVANSVTAPLDLFGEEITDSQTGSVVCRLNKQWEWKPLKIGAFLAEARSIREYDDLTKIGMAISKLEVSNGGAAVANVSFNMGMNIGGNTTILKVFEEYKDRPVVEAVMKVNAEMTGKKIPMNQADVKKKIKSLINDIFAQVNRSGETFKPETFSWYNRNHAQSSALSRKSCVNSLNLALDQMK